jgi:TP901 family phage tail tape measure protein
LNLGDIKVDVGVNTDPLKQGLAGAKQAVLSWAQEVKISEQHLAALTQQMDREAAAARREVDVKRQQAALERELFAAKSQLTAVLAQESAAAQAAAAKYDLLNAAQRQELVTVRESIEGHRIATADRLRQADQDIAAEQRRAAAATARGQAEAAADDKAYAAYALNQQKRVADAQKNLGRNVQTLGRGLTGAVTTPILGIAAAGIAGQVELQGAEVAAAQASGATGAAAERLDAIIKRVAVSVPNSFKDIGRAVGELAARTGEGGAQLEKLATTELNLSRITGEGTGVIRATTQAFAAWNVTAENQVPVLDMLEKAHQLTGVRVTALATDLARSAPILKQWGLSLTDSTALLAGFERVGIGPQRLIAGLATGLSRLAKAGVTDAHQALTIILKDLSDTEHPMTALAEATRLFGARVGAQLVGAVRSGALSLDDLKKKLEDSGGAIEKTTSQSETFFTALNKLGHQAAVAVAPLGKLLLDMATQFLQAAQPLIALIARLVDWFSKLPPGVKEAIVNFALLAAAFGPVVEWAGKAYAGFLKMKVAWEGVKLAFLGAEGAEGIVASLGAIGTAVGALSVGWIAAFAAIGLVTLAFVTNFHGWRDDFVSGIRVIGGTLSNLFTGHGTQSLADAQLSEGQRRYEMALSGQVHENRGSLNRAAANAIPKYNVGGMGESAADIRSRLSGIGAAKTPQTPLEKEQTRYTEELTQAHAKLTELLTGEDNIAGQVAARYHLLTAAQRENLTAVLQQIHDQQELQRNQKQYDTDLGKLQASIRRLKQGHDAEASGVDALKEKYPQLSRAQLEVMNNAIQWKKHLEEVQAAAHKVAEEMRSLTLRALENTAQTKAGAEAMRLFGEELLKKHPELNRPGVTAQQVWPYLSPDQQRQAKRAAGSQEFGDIGGDITQMQQQIRQMSYVSRTNQISQQFFGTGAGNLGEKALEQVHQYEDLENVIQQVTAAYQAYRGEQQKVNEVIGTAGFNLGKLQERTEILTRGTVDERDAFLQLGVNLRDLPKDIQAIVKASFALDRRFAESQKFIQQFTQGTEQVFQEMFHGLMEHGFKGFFENVKQGFTRLFQDIAAQYLASKLTDLILGKPDSGGNRGGGFLNSIFGLGAAVLGGSRGGGGATGGVAGPVLGPPIPAGLASVQSRSTFVPRMAGTQLAAAGAGGNGGHVTVNLNVSTPDVAGFRQNSKALLADSLRHAQSIQRRNGG